jgi:predicted ester cyclase
MSFTAFPDLHFTLEDRIAEGDKVVSRWTFHGTHKGELQGMPPSGKQVTMTGISIDRLAWGKVVESWDNPDQLGLLQQIGALATPGQAS